MRENKVCTKKLRVAEEEQIRYELLRKGFPRSVIAKLIKLAERSATSKKLDGYIILD
jgi:hypothetical protein